MEKIKMTTSSYNTKKDRYDYINQVLMVENAEKLKEARSHGDLSENAEYDEAKSEQAKLYSEMQKLKYELENAEIDDTINKSVKVLRKLDNQEITYSIVGSGDQNVKENKISSESPVGSAIGKAEVGQTVKVEAPMGVIEFVILDIE